MNGSAPFPARILIVDDEPVIASTLSAIVRTAGYEARAVFNASEAIAEARNFVPDILLIDYRMPGMNGLEAACTIQGLLPACRILFLTAESVEDEVTPYRKRGYNFVLLSKPIPPVELLYVLKLKDYLPGSNSHRATILNVDDVDLHRYSVTRLLSHAGFAVLEANTGMGAMRIAEELKPDLLLLDINLPDGNGYEVCRRLKCNPQTSGISIIHTTASDNTDEGRSRSQESGADLFVSHPFDPQTLISQVRSVLQIEYLRQTSP
jgi:CheY-like chemotaxis protein